VTHNSLVANQRAHISLIDRRHLRPRRVPHRAIQLKDMKAAAFAGAGTARAIDSVKPYQRRVQRRALVARPLQLKLGSMGNGVRNELLRAVRHASLRQVY
jgi:hypothetical protein